MEYKLTFKEYSEALKGNKLLGLKCQDCGSITIPPKMVCGKCTSPNMKVVELKGTGKIQTFTTINVAPEGRETECPYTIVLVELDEGPWVMGNLIGIDPTKVTLENLVKKKVKIEKGEIFPGDKYSAGEGVRPLFKIAA